jgi:hypothetical protein
VAARREKAQAMAIAGKKPVMERINGDDMSGLPATPAPAGSALRGLAAVAVGKNWRRIATESGQSHRAKIYFRGGDDPVWRNVKGRPKPPFR